MTIMKNSTACGLREMRALYEERQVNVAAPESRVRDTGQRNALGQPIYDRPASRKRRDHGTAAWNDRIIDAARSMPRASRRALARLGEKETTKRIRGLPRAMAKGVNNRVPDPATRPASTGVWGYVPTVSSAGKPGR